MFATGVILASIRLYEPLYKFLLKRFAMNCYGQILEKDSEGIQSKTLSSFLASSLNVELVHIILKGIKKFSQIQIPETLPTEIERNSMT